MSLLQNQVQFVCREIDVEFVILGTGDKILFIERVRETLAKMGMQVDVQDTVFNQRILLTESKMLRVCSTCYKQKGGVSLLRC